MVNPPEIAGKKALLLDMNSTFMFGEDRFSNSEDFSVYYSKIGGTFHQKKITRIILDAYSFLDSRYPDECYRHSFPSLKSAILEVIDEAIDENEIRKIIETFAFHELGFIPDEYAEALHRLKQRFVLAAIIDIWAPKQLWLKEFERSGVLNLFSALSFSSDHGMVKPSPTPYELVLKQLGIPKAKSVVVGDSIRRDLGGARNADIDCILVGGTRHPEALMSFDNLLCLCDALID
jgi:FMN phosphatase YigB (HAD superfamily)